MFIEGHLEGERGMNAEERTDFGALEHVFESARAAAL
jgi:hypothetical protein